MPIADKPLVIYDAGYPGTFIMVGHSAWVKPLNHPSPLVSNTGPAITSTVVSYNEKSGEFETMFTRYTPLKE